MKKISVRATTATAPTELSAFDRTLCKMGLGNANLIHLSSVVPKDFSVEVTENKHTLDKNHQGDRMYVVYADNRTSTVGDKVAAGLGWVLTDSDGGWGLFVEHVGETEDDVQELINKSLTSMMADRQEYEWGNIQSKIISTASKKEPVCALVLATYKREDW